MEDQQLTASWVLSPLGKDGAHREWAWETHFLYLIMGGGRH